MSMDETTANQEFITQEKAEKLADAYLKQRYYNFDRIIFKECEELKNEGIIFYRFKGQIIEKTRNLMDMLSRDRSSFTYQFVIDMSSKNGKVLNYYLK